MEEETRHRVENEEMERQEQSNKRRRHPPATGDEIVDIDPRPPKLTRKEANSATAAFLEYKE